MNPFEKGLRSEIPLEAAADFFIKLKYGSAENMERMKLAELQQQLKSANAAMGYNNVPQAGTPAPAPLMPPAPPTKLPDSAMGKHAAKFKKALSGMFGEGISAPGSVAPQVDMSQYMEMEQMGEEAEASNQTEFLRSKLEMANAELQAARDQAMQAQQTAQQLEMSQSQHEQQLQAAQQQSQLATQAAMQNVQQAHQLAMQATSQALQAKDDAINTHSLAAKMRMAYQDLRGNIMDAVAQDNAAPVGEAIKAQGALAAAPTPGMEDPSMGGDPNAPPPAEGAPEGAPAEQAAGAEAPPGTAPADGAPQEGAAPAGPPQAEDGATGEGPKVAGVAGDMFGAAMGHLKQKAPYALAGGLLGGGLTAIESRVGHEGLRNKVQQMESQPGGGFGKALRLASAKARLAVGEAVEKHPIPATMAGAAMGASAGMSLGPGIMEGFQMLPDRLRELQKG